MNEGLRERLTFLAHVWETQMRTMYLRFAVCLIALLVTSGVLGGSQPDSAAQEADIREVAIGIAAAAKASPTTRDQEVFWSVGQDLRDGSDFIHISAYGLSGAEEEEQLLDKVRGHLAKKQYRSKVIVSFYPKREYTVEKRADGATSKKLKRVAATRRVEINR
jgi:hypothetical protein